MRRRMGRWAVVAVLVVALAATGWQVGGLIAGNDHAAPINPQAVQVAESLSQAFKQAASAVRPSVVSIISTKQVQPIMRGGGAAQPDLPEELKRFFGDDFGKFFGTPPFPRPQQPFRSKGQGSGVIVSADGLVLTNNHVVAGADEVKVRLHDGREFEAKVIGTDPKTDVAVVKIEAANLSPARLGDSDDVEVGDWVLAVGSPFALDQTVTSGIISAKGRANVGLAVYEDYLQTDAAINPGNSGGPLVNLHGEVIGINTAIASRSGGNMGIGFAIPINMAREIMTQLASTGHVERGFLGVGLQRMTPELARSFGLKRPHGALVSDVTPESGAAKAGLQPGDVIVRFDGSEVDSATTLRRLVAAVKPGRQATVEVLRNGERRTFNVTIGRRPDDVDLSAAPGRPAPQAGSTDQKLGLTVKTLSPSEAKSLGYPESTRGVAVVNVVPGGVAQLAGLRTGDIILSVGGESVTTADAYRDAIKKSDLKKGVRLYVLRGDVKQFIFLQVE